MHAPRSRRAISPVRRYHTWTGAHDRTWLSADHKGAAASRHQANSDTYRGLDAGSGDSPARWLVDRRADHGDRSRHGEVRRELGHTVDRARGHCRAS